MRLPFFIGTILGLASISAAEVTDAERQQFYDTWQTILPKMASNLEYCLLPLDDSEYCAAFSNYEEGPPTSAKQHLDASILTVSTFNILLRPLEVEYVSDLKCKRPQISGDYLSPEFSALGVTLAVRASKDSCYIEILDEADAS